MILGFQKIGKEEILFDKEQNRNNINRHNNSGGLVARGVGKPFQQSATTCSRTGEKETLNINVVGQIDRKSVV